MVCGVETGRLSAVERWAGRRGAEAYVESFRERRVLP